MQPTISLCIPTKNRAALLDRCLEAIFTAPAYDPCRVEVVVSDNASTDNTPEIVQRHIDAGHKITYNRNEHNLGTGAELNFIKALSLANGALIKLLNDYTLLTDAALQAYLQFATEHAADRPTAIFLQNKRNSYRRYDALNGVIHDAEWKLAWIGAHVYWKEEWDALPEKTKAIDTCFMQLDWCLRLCHEERGIYVIEGDFFHNVKLPTNKVDYDWFETHTTKFFSVLRPSLDSHVIDRHTYDHVRKVLYKAMLHSLKDRCFKQPCTSDRRQAAIATLRTNFSDLPFFRIHFPLYIAKLYVKFHIGYWKLLGRLKRQSS